MNALIRPSRSARLAIGTSQRWLTTQHPSPSTIKWSQPPSSTSISDDDVASLASKPLHTLALADLVKHGRPPLSPSALLSSANFTLSLLPTRLAHRIVALRNLPFIVVSNPHISKIYNNYLYSLSTLLPYTKNGEIGKISTMEEEVRFTEVLAELVETHSNTIPVLARGLAECRRYMGRGAGGMGGKGMEGFLDEHLRARIGTRLIAEQHIALHLASVPQSSTSSSFPPETQPQIGTILPSLSPVSIINSCATFVSEICELKYGIRPTWTIDGDTSTTFSYVPVHLEYIVTELLKNAFRATVENGGGEEQGREVRITVAAEPADCDVVEEGVGAGSGADGGDGRDLNNGGKSGSGRNGEGEKKGSIKPLAGPAPGLTIRIRDRGGGINPAVLPDIWGYSFTTFNQEDEAPYTSNMTSNGGGGSMDGLNAIAGADQGGSSIAGLGYGLPLGRAYAEFFGGGIEVQSLFGWGTDVYLRLKGVGRVP